MRTPFDNLLQDLKAHRRSVAERFCLVMERSMRPTLDLFAGIKAPRPLADLQALADALVRQQRERISRIGSHFQIGETLRHVQLDATLRAQELDHLVGRDFIPTALPAVVTKLLPSVVPNR